METNTVTTIPGPCPGCGRCRTCGQPAPIVVHPPYPAGPYAPQPLRPWGQQIQPGLPTVTC